MEKPSWNQLRFYTDLPRTLGAQLLAMQVYVSGVDALCGTYVDS
jgi:hypothetical protein